MPSESAVSSPTAPQTQGEGKTTAANVSKAQAIAAFIKASETPSDATPAADTSAPEAEAPAAAEETPAAEQTPSASTEAPANDEAQEETSAETPAASETKPEDEANDVLSNESQSLDQKLKDKIQRRINKEVGKRKALEAQLEQLRSQVNNLTQTQQQKESIVAPPTEVPIPHIKDPAALADYRKQVKTAARNVEALLDRDDIDNGVSWGEKTYTKAELKQTLREARALLEDTIPAQEEYFRKQEKAQQQRAQYHSLAVQKFPFLAEKDNQEVAMAADAFKQAFGAQALEHPMSSWFVGAYVHGVKNLVAAEEAAKNSKPVAEKPAAAKPAMPAPVMKPKPPSDQTAISTSAGAPRQSPDAAARAALRPLSGNQSASSVAAFLAQQEALKQARR